MDNYIQVIINYGGLGVVALFAWVLLKSVLKSLDYFTQLTSNHLEHLDKTLEKVNTALENLDKSVNRLSDFAERREERK